MSSPDLWSRRLLDGSREPLSKSLSLRAGPLSLLFEAGGLRYLRLDEVELVWRVYAAVRDANWGTVPNEFSNLEVNSTDDTFQLEFDVRNRQDEIDFSWHGSISGDAAGRIAFSLRGVVHSTFQRNRIGFCVLHPMDLAGIVVEVTHADGSRETTQFPRFIAPTNPFLNVVGLQHSAATGYDLLCTFEGDVFETEDQRNWSDASFKTFCTPLSRPFPVTVTAGEVVAQRVILELVPAANQTTPVAPPAARAAGPRPIKLTFHERPTHRLPKIGFGLPANAAGLSPLEISRLQALRPSHLRCELKIPGDFAAQFQSIATFAETLDTGLDAVLFLGDRAERDFPHLAECVRRSPARIARWTIFPQTGWSTTCELVERHARELRKIDPTILIGGGTPASFCELNRNRPPADALDFVTWSMQPQEHAFDNASLVETLAAQAAIVDSVRRFGGNLPLVVGPITFKKRVNPYATGPWPLPQQPGELPIQVDPRQATLFGAAWTLGSIKYLAESGVDAITYYELIGWKGLMESASGSSLPDLFPSVPAGVFPLYHVFAELAELRGASVVPVRSSAPLDVDTLALASDAGELTCVLLANFSPQEQRVTWPCHAQAASIRLLSEENIVTAITSPESYRVQLQLTAPIHDGHFELSLPPFALARLDLR